MVIGLQAVKQLWGGENARTYALLGTKIAKV